MDVARPYGPSDVHAPYRMLAGENVGSRFVVPTVAASIDLVVHLGLEPGGARTVREIVGIPGRVEGDVVEVADIFTSRGGGLVRAQGFPPHPERFERIGVDVAQLLRHDPADVGAPA